LPRNRATSHVFGVIGWGVHCVRREPILPKNGGQQLPHFRPTGCGQTAGWMKMPLGTEVGLSQGHIVPDGTQVPPQKRCTAHPIFDTSVVAKRLDRSRCHLIRRRSRPRRHCITWGLRCPLPPKKVHSRHFFGPCLLWPNGWMDQCATCY